MRKELRLEVIGFEDFSDFLEPDEEEPIFEMEFHLRQEGHSHLLVGDSVFLDKWSRSAVPLEPITIEFAKKVTALIAIVTDKGPTANSYRILSNGSIGKLITTPCERWRELIAEYYLAGYRFVRFEWEYVE